MAKKPLPDLGDLVERSKRGDTEAFGQVYDALVKPIYRYIYYRVEPQIAEDLTEDTFLKVWENLKKFKQGKTPFSAWVFRIAHNLVCDHYRKNETVFEIDENIANPTDDLNPQYQISVKLNQVHLRQALKKLPENYQEVLVLKYINDVDNTTIAQTIGKSEGAVRILQFRALNQLRIILEKY